MPTIKSEFSCPTCKQTTGALVQIIANAGELLCSNGHRWNDTQAFYNERPTMDFKAEVPGNLPQENYSPLNISVPTGLVDALKQLYGAKLSATCSAILHQMVEGKAMLIPNTDVERLREHLGKRPDNSGELVGLVYAKVCEADDVRAEKDTAVKELRAYEKLSPGCVVIDLGDQYQTAQQLAQDAELPLKIWAEQRFKNAVESQWF